MAHSRTALASPVEPRERRMLFAMQNLAVEPGALGIVFDTCNAEFGMGERSRETRHGNLRRGHERPVAAAGDEPRENTGIVGIIGDGEWSFHKIVESRRRPKRRDNPPLPVLDQAERREMRPARSIDGRDNGFPDHRHFAIPQDDHVVEQRLLFFFA